MKKISLIIILCLFSLQSGCNTFGGKSKPRDVDATIGSMVQVVSPNIIPVEGVGLVGGLNGNGSAECPDEIRSYLSQYLMSQMTEDRRFNTESAIKSLDTAVVYIQGNLIVENSKSQYFDIKISALRGTQTISLANGWLERSELKRIGNFGIDTEILADAEGPVFINSLLDSSSEFTDPRTGYILAGGKTLIDFVISLILPDPDFQVANDIRNRINLRFGSNIAKARPDLIEVTVPQEYRAERAKFIELIRAMYFDDAPENTQLRINKHIQQIVTFPDSDAGEIALEAIGIQSVRPLSNLLGSPDEHVRLRAARCMLNLRNDTGLGVLLEIAANTSSAYRIEAIEAAAKSRRRDATSLLYALLKDRDFNISLAAYEQLSKAGDTANITRSIVASKFSLDEIKELDRTDLYVSRSGRPKVVMFGSPFVYKKGITIESESRDIMITAPADQDYVLLLKRHPRREDLARQVRCPSDLSSIIRVLCSNQQEREGLITGGLGVSYSDLLPLLKQMCDKGAVNAIFHAGPLPKID